MMKTMSCKTGRRAAVFATLWMVAVHGEAATPGHADAVEIDNGLVKARFTPDADGIRQEFFAVRGKDWVLLAESFRPAASSGEGHLFADFEGDTYGEWKVTGTAFGERPAAGAGGPEQLLQNFRGRQLANSYDGSDASVGTLASPEFKIEHPYLRFLIGGGQHPGETCMNLVVDGETVATQTGANSDALRPAEWDLRAWMGRTAHLEIIDRSTGGWGHVEIDQIEFSDHPMGQSAGLYDTSRDPEHRLLVSTALKSIGPVTRDDNGASIVLRGTAGGAEIEQTVSLGKGRKIVRVEVTARISGELPKLEYLLVPWVAVIDGKPDSIHAPTYKPTDDSVIGDRCFFSPLTCVQKGENFIGLMPDLDLINRAAVYAPGSRQHPDSNSFPVQVPSESVSMPTAMDLDLGEGGASRPILSYGMMDYIVHQHVWFQHPESPGTMVRTLSGPRVRIGMDLMLSADAPPHRGFQMASQHMWRRYGRRHFLQPRPQAMPLADYARICYPANLHFQGYGVGGGGTVINRLPNRPDLETWQQWEEGGRPVGGLRLYAPQWSNFIANMGWWNNVCDAIGFFHWGKQLGDEDLQDKARRMVNLALSAPQNRGLFPALYDLGSKTWARSLWHPPISGYDPNRRDAYWSSPGAYQTASASVTAGYLMEYRRGCEDDPRILPYVRRYADFLVENMQPNGCVPGWFSEDLKPLPSLRWNADGGAHMWVLSEVYRATGEKTYLEAAQRAARFMAKEVMPNQRWADFEAFYSCAIKPETFFDQRTGQWPCNTMSMSWALQGFLALFEATHDRTHLDDAAAVADYASLFQAVWAPHFIITAYPFGGISSQVGDAEWLDQRAHRFADPFVRIGLLTGRQDLVERGIAAARSCLTLVNHPRHLANDIYRHPNFPLGLGPENIDHEGFPQMPMSSGPSWGSVGGLAAMAQLLDRLGGVHVDVDRDIACGVDGVTVDAFRREGRTIHLRLSNPLAALPEPYDQPYSVELRVVGLPRGEYQLVINDQPPRRSTAEELAHYRLRVDKEAMGRGINER
jgi:hypothetical protein